MGSMASSNFGFTLNPKPLGFGTSCSRIRSVAGHGVGNIRLKCKWLGRVASRLKGLQGVRTCYSGKTRHVSGLKRPCSTIVYA